MIVLAHWVVILGIFFYFVGMYALHTHLPLGRLFIGFALGAWLAGAGLLVACAPA